jgi:hypothetical protein
MQLDSFDYKNMYIVSVEGGYTEYDAVTYFVYCSFECLNFNGISFECFAAGC